MTVWERDDLSTVRSFSQNPGFATLDLPSGRAVKIERWQVRFPAADPPKLHSAALSKTYTTKPLVQPFETPLFGELAILRCLENDGWNGVWVDTFHGRGKKLCWQDLPDRSHPFDLSGGVIRSV